MAAKVNRITVDLTGYPNLYDDVPVPPGLAQFAPRKPALGAMFSARKRARLGGEPPLPAPVPEENTGFQ